IRDDLVTGVQTCALPISSKPLAKPYATFLTDAYSRRLLAVHVSYEPPSYRSVMMAFRLCVQRYGRLPQEIVVDHGPEFGSVYFRSEERRVGKKFRCLLAV